MALDILVNATSATVTTGGTTAPAAGTIEQWTVTQTGWPSIPSPTLQTRLLDKADLGNLVASGTGAYELMLLQNIAATSLTAALVSGTAYTTLDVEALPQAMNSGDSVILGVGATTQTVVLSAAAAAGAVSLTVTSFTASAAFAIGTPVTDFTTPGANLNGSVWTVERGVEGTIPKVHGSNWTVVPTPSEGGLNGALGAGALLGRTQYSASTKIIYTLSGTLTALDPTNLTVSFTTAKAGPGSTEVLAACVLEWETNAMTYWGFTGTGAPSTPFDINNAESPWWQYTEAFIGGLTPNTAYLWNLAAQGGGSAIVGTDYNGATPGRITIRAGLI